MVDNYFLWSIEKKSFCAFFLRQIVFEKKIHLWFLSVRVSHSAPLGRNGGDVEQWRRKKHLWLWGRIKRVICGTIPLSSPPSTTPCPSTRSPFLIRLQLCIRCVSVIYWEITRGASHWFVPLLGLAVCSVCEFLVFTRWFLYKWCVDLILFSSNSDNSRAFIICFGSQICHSLREKCNRFSDFLEKGANGSWYVTC